MIFLDQLDRKINILKTPKRIISLVPSLTELLVDLGLENQLVGVTRFCIHPNYIKKLKTTVGGTKKVNFDKIIALKPDFILTNKEENSQEIVNQVSKIAPTFVSNLNTINDVLVLINQLGNIFDCEDKSIKIIDKIKTKQNDFLNFIKEKPNKKVAYFIWANPFMVVGNNTFINELLKLNNLKNVFDNIERYPEIKIEKLPELDCIFLSSEPYPFKEKHLELFTNFTNAKIILVDGEFFSWYGSRLIKAFDYFKELHLKINQSNF